MGSKQKTVDLELEQPLVGIAVLVKSRRKPTFWMTIKREKNPFKRT